MIFLDESPLYDNNEEEGVVDNAATTRTTTSNSPFHHSPRTMTTMPMQQQQQPPPPVRRVVLERILEDQVYHPPAGDSNNHNNDSYHNNATSSSSSRRWAMMASPPPLWMKHMAHHHHNHNNPTMTKQAQQQQQRLLRLPFHPRWLAFVVLVLVIGVCDLPIPKILSQQQQATTKTMQLRRVSRSQGSHSPSVAAKDKAGRLVVAIKSQQEERGVDPFSGVVDDNKVWKNVGNEEDEESSPHGGETVLPEMAAVVDAPMPEQPPATNNNSLPLLFGPPEDRKNRFPSVEERIRIYMGPWYLPPCNANHIYFYQYKYNHTEDEKEEPTLTLWQGAPAKLVNATVHVGTSPWNRSLFFAVQQHYDACQERYEQELINMRAYHECLDLKRSVPRDLFWHAHASTNVPPILRRVGDGPQPFSLPTIHYCRVAVAASSQPNAPSATMAWSHTGTTTTPAACSQNISPDHTPLPPIVWNLNTDRFIKPLYSVAEQDVPWSQKKNAAVFRGQMTGGPRSVDESIFGEAQATFPPMDVTATAATADSNNNKNPNYGNSTIDKAVPLEDVKICEQNPRCRLALMHDKSDLVDAKLVGSNEKLLVAAQKLKAGNNNNTKVKISNKGRKVSVLSNGVNILGTKMDMASQLKYKGLIFLDGNDVASGVKWAMLSRSVVLMKPSRFTSWAMDEILEPYVHYVPLNDDYSNVEEQMQWVLDHDKEAQEIALRSSLWIQDLMLTDQAKADNTAVQMGILKRYAAHFQPASSLQ